ncbi:hypothetical protein ASD88_13480 [Pelomonas sp. Root662]|nr:hypothetical protein ASC81_24135 [Pelomonas sp. Root405]KRA70852.1 hypothetical protein ASD88_13480 [Pelomonas sp. Root662]
MVKSFVVASALLAGSFAAQAASFALGTGPLGTTTVNGGNVILAPGLVNDTFTFSLASASTVQSNVTGFFGNFSPAFYSIVSTGADHVVGGGDDAVVTGFAFTSTSTGNFTNLSAGDYYFNVFALANQGPSAYAISASATALPVPEPETYALFGAGLGIVGFIAARRRRNS